MYRIIGADQKEYGPITGDQIRQWISEGRVNAQTQVRAEGSEEWKPLSAFLEFGGSFQAPPPSLLGRPLSSSPDLARGAAEQAVKGPAIALIIVAAIELLMGLWNILKLLMQKPGFENVLNQISDPEARRMAETILKATYGPLGVASGFFQVAASILILAGAIRMLSLRNYTLAFAAAVVSLLPCLTPCCCLGLPFGIWAIVVLNRSEVKTQFL